MKDMSIKENTKFPIAAVFYILAALFSGLSILTSVIQLYRSYNLRVALGGVFGMCLRLVLLLAIILLLCLKKRNVLLFLAVGMQAVSSAISAGSNLLRAKHIV